mgnify:CR=1 FL=1
MQVAWLRIKGGMGVVAVFRLDKEAVVSSQQSRIRGAYGRQDDMDGL